MVPVTAGAASALRVVLLGRFLVESAGVIVPEAAWHRRGAAALVKLLAFSPGHSLHRDQILDALWPDIGLDTALNHFRKALYAARRALEPQLQAHAPSSYLQLVGETLSLTDVWVDVDEFERLARVAVASKQTSQVEAALAAYVGELLPEDRYEPWVEERRASLGNRYLELLRWSATRLEQEGALQDAVERLNMVLQYDSTDEEAHRSLMRIHAASGRRSRALEQYRACTQALRDELDTGPTPETEELHRRIRDGTEVGTQVHLSVPLTWRTATNSLMHLSGELRQAEEWTAALLEQTADAGRLAGATELAERYFRELVRRYERLGEDASIARACEKLAATLGTMGRYDEALAVLDRAVQLYQPMGDAEGAARTIARIGRLHYRRGSAREAITVLESAVATLHRDRSSQAERMLHTSLAFLYLDVGSYDDSLRAADYAATLAAEAQDDLLSGMAETVRGLVLLHHGDAGEASQALEQAVRLADAVGDLDTLTRALDGLAEARLATDQRDSVRSALEQAVAAARRLGTPERVAYTSYRLGAILTVQGRYKEALRLLHEAVGLYTSLGDLDRQALVTSELGQLDFHLARATEGIERLEGMLARVDDQSVVVAPLLVSLASLYWLAGRYDDQLAAAERAERLAASSSSSRAGVQAAVWRGVAHLALGRISKGIAELEAVVPRAEAIGDFASACRALNSIGAAYYERGELDKQEPYLDRALVAAERSGAPLRLAFMHYARGCRAWMVGRWNEAAHDFERALGTTHDLGRCWVRPYAHLGLACLSLGREEWAAAAAHLEVSLREAHGGGDARAVWAAEGLRGELELRRGNWGAAKEWIGQALRRTGLSDGDRALFLAILAQAYLHLDEAETAMQLVARAERCARRGDSGPASFEVLYVRGLLAVRQSWLEEAASLLDQATTHARAMHSPYLEARALQPSIAVRDQLGHRTLAEECRQQSETILRRLGVRSAQESARLSATS